MKKLSAAVLALCLLFSAALAESPVVVNWADTFEPAIAAANVEGQFWTLNQVAVKFWLPAMLQSVELSDEDVANGYLAYFADEKGEAAVAVTYANAEGASVEEYADYLKTADGVAEVELCVVNGLPAVTYKMPGNDSVNITFATQAGYLLEITMAPLSVENADMVWGAVAASIQAAE